MADDEVCPACGGELIPLGTLGNRVHSRCRACGLDSSEAPIQTTNIGPTTKELWEAFEESIRLQSHYASLLNMHDGGQRLIFSSPHDFIARLRYLKKEE